ncbi:MAG: metal-dependent hydrolase [Bacteroidetes bacterium]|nr:metal-dependent hydrolase [Bacteroidota bacterium]
MDTVTHIVVGAAVGEIFVGKQLRRKALWWGMVAQSLPDIDVIASLWTSPSEDLLAHRGFTHSLLFLAIAAFFCSLVSERWHRKHDIAFRSWLLFWGVEIFIHLFLDCMNAYGTGLLEPFSHKRFSFNVIFVADPFFSIWTALALIAVFAFRTHKNKTHWAIIALSISGLYLGYCGFNKLKAEQQLERALQAQHIKVNRHFSTPTMFNSWLWYIVAEGDSGYYIGYYSVLSRNDSIHFAYYPRNENLIGSMYKNEDLERLLRFSQGYYTAEQWHDTLVFNDLRFGQIGGWGDDSAKFVFHYFLRGAGDNELVVQRGRFAALKGRNLRSFIMKVKGN